MKQIDWRKHASETKFDEKKTHFDTNHCMTVLWSRDNDARPTTPANIAMSNPSNHRLPIVLGASIRLTPAKRSAISLKLISSISLPGARRMIPACARPRRSASASLPGTCSNLTLADPDLNRDEKGAKDAADWVPGEKQVLVCVACYRRSPCLWPHH